MPAAFRSNLHRWRMMHPEWRLVVWTPETTPTLRNQDMFDDPAGWSAKSNPWQWKSDLARYEILYDQGGVYVDADLEPLRPVDDLIAGCDVVLGWEDDQFVTNGFLGSRPGSDFLADVIGGLRDRARRMWDCRVNKSIGPHYVSEVFKSHPEVRALPREYLYPYHWSELHRAGEDFAAQGAYTVHHWNNQRKLRDG